MDQTQAPIPALNIDLRKGVFEDASSFELAQRVASCLITAGMVPERYRGKDNLGNAMIAIDLAKRLGLGPTVVMQELYVVYGTPSWSGKMMLALVNGSGLFKEPLEYEMKGKPGQDDWGCRCFAETKSGKKTFGPWVDIAMAKAEGWYDRKDKDGRYCSKWRTIPEMMLRYRAAAYFGRTICPDVMLGLRTVDEEEEIVPRGTVIEVTSTADTAAGTTPLLEQTGQPTISNAPTKAKRIKPAVPTKPVETPAQKVAPEPSASAPTPPAASQGPATPSPEPPAETPKAEAKPMDAADMAYVIAEQLKEAGVTVDDFFDWIKGSGRDHTYSCDPDSISEISELPQKLLVDLINGDLQLCIKTMAPR